MSRDKVYPSKRVKNYAAKKLRRIFKLKGKVILKHAPNIYYDGDICYGLCFSSDRKNPMHRIIIAEDINGDIETYKSTLLHEYVHAWQFENRMPLKHNRQSMFTAWARYLAETQNGVEI